jgi:anti-sigma factor RsiW
MNCQEAINLWSSYQDGELDAPFCREIETHLAACPDCRRFFETQAEFDGALTRALKERPPTASLWQRQEKALQASFKPPEPERAPGSFWVQLLWPNRGVFVALAVLWLLLLVANRLADYGTTTQTQKPSAAQRAILAEQRREFKTLLMAGDSDPTPSVTHRLGPRSHRQSSPASIPTTSLGQTQSIPQIS